MKTSVLLIVFTLCVNGLWSQCNPKVKILIPEGYSLVKDLEISMERSSDSTQTYTFLLNNLSEYQLLFVEEDNFKNIVSYELFENAHLLGSNYSKATNLFYPSFNFKCAKTATYELKVKKIANKKYCGHCLLLLKKAETSQKVVNTEKEGKKDVYLIVDESPFFVEGKGIEAFQEWVAKNIVYPEEAKKNGIVGKVFVQFVVNSKGKVEGVKIIRSVDPILDNEAVRVISSSPIWYKPGYLKGEAVNVALTIPIYFKN